MIEALQSGSASAVAVIEKSRVQAEACVESTSGSLALMENMSDAIQSINNLNTQIATAANEQHAVVAEVSKNVSNILDVSTRTASDSAAAALSASELLQMSEGLKSYANKFRIV